MFAVLPGFFCQSLMPESSNWRFVKSKGQGKKSSNLVPSAWFWRKRDTATWSTSREGAKGDDTVRKRRKRGRDIQRFNWDRTSPSSTTTYQIDLRPRDSPNFFNDMDCRLDHCVEKFKRHFVSRSTSSSSTNDANRHSCRVSHSVKRRIMVRRMCHEV